MRLLILLLLSATISLSSAQERILYLYGDVAADGTTPSGPQEPFHQMRLNDAGRLGMLEFKQAIEAAQFEIEEAYDAEVRLTPSFLKAWDVLILASNQRLFEPEEVKAVHAWVKQGGGLVAWSDSAFGGHYRKVGIDNTAGRDSNNRITADFGMSFLTDNGGGNYLIKNQTEDHFLNAYQKDGGIHFRGEGVSFVRTTPPAKVLAYPQGGGLGGLLKVNPIDAPFNPETDAALAIAEIGKGRVVGIFDRNLFWNAGDGTRLSHSDNREFTQRVMLWAAGVENESRIPATDRKDPSTRNTIPTVTVSYTMDADGKTITLCADIIDTDSDRPAPEIKWMQRKGPAKSIFENNNANTPAPRVTLPKQGSYLFMARVTDGEFQIKKMVTVERQPK